MILLNLPQGMVTFGAAVLSALIVALVSLTIGLFRVAISVHSRLTGLETRVEIISSYADERRINEMSARTDILWERHKSGVPNLIVLRPPENPMKQERWNELTYKLAEEKISDDEAEEFLAALLKREEQAKEEKDLGALAVLEHGIILTKYQLRVKELRESRDEK